MAWGWWRKVKNLAGRAYDWLKDKANLVLNTAQKVFTKVEPIAQSIFLKGREFADSKNPFIDSDSRDNSRSDSRSDRSILNDEKVKTRKFVPIKHERIQFK